jgi:hypothetical protein
LEAFAVLDHSALCLGQANLELVGSWLAVVRTIVRIMAGEVVDRASLSEVEGLLVDHVTRGERLDLAGEEAVDEAAMRSWGTSRTVRASILRDILRGRLAPDADPHGLRLRGARIVGRLDLESLTTSVFVELFDCLLEEGLVARGARLPFLSVEGCLLEHSSEPALSAARLTAAALFLDRAVITSHCNKEAVRVAGAHLGQFDLIGTELRNDSGPALGAEGLRVEEIVFFDWLTAIGAGEQGAVRLTNAHLGGLHCTDMKLYNDSGPALIARELRVDHDVVLNGFTAVGGGKSATVNLSGTRIAGTLTFDPARLENSENNDARLNLDGLTYAGLPTGISSRDWLRLLREGTTTYAAQPYQHLAAAHRAAGHDDQARQILIAQRKDQLDRRALGGRAERTWVRLTGLILGYGYQSWRALVALLAVIAVSTTLTVILGAHGGVARTHPASASSQCSAVERIGVGLDLGLPLIKTGTRERCDLTDTTTGQILTIASWGLQLLAWAFATLFVAGFTSAVRKT